MTDMEKKEKQFEDDFRTYWDIDQCDMKTSDMIQFLVQFNKSLREPCGLTWTQIERIVDKVIYYG